MPIVLQTMRCTLYAAIVVVMFPLVMLNHLRRNAADALHYTYLDARFEIASVKHAWRIL